MSECWAYMGTKLSPAQLDLYLTIDRILLNEWDPIGVSGCQGAEDEYHGYLPQIFSMVTSHSDAEKIAPYLNWVVTERMELKSNLEHNLRIAERCIEAGNACGLTVNGEGQ